MQPGWLEPELATLTADRFSDPAWIFERKFDGERCLAFRDGEQLRLVTRNQQQVTGTYPEIAEALRAQEPPTSSWTARSWPSTASRPASPGCNVGSGSAIRAGAARRGAGVQLPVRRAVGRRPRRAPAPLLERKALLRDLLSFA